MQLEREQIPQWLRTILARSALGVGVTPITWLMLKTTYRAPWSYATTGAVWKGEVRKQSPSRGTHRDIELCRRLIDAFVAATDGDLTGPQAVGVWGWIFDNYQRPLAEAIEQRDADALAETLASMFQEDFALGISPGSTTLEHTRSWLGSRILCMKCIDGLISLGEALALQPVRNPEQQRIGLSLANGLPRLIADLETRLGFSIDFPDVGAPYGLAVGQRLITVETPEQIYGALRLNHAINLHLTEMEAQSPRIVEIGGGYGAMCYWYLHINPSTANYTIVDLPIIGLLQGYFLGRSLGPDHVSFFGEPERQVSLLPVSARVEVKAPFEVLVNKDSMPEMPYDTVLDYLRWGHANCDGFFFSYNHESAADFQGHPQGRVSDAIAEVGGFSRLRRERSWVRPGYVEEIYSPRPPDSHDRTNGKRTAMAGERLAATGSPRSLR